MIISKTQIIDEFDEVLRQHLIEQSLEHGNKELFMKLTGSNWLEHLYSSKDTNTKNFVQEKDYEIKQRNIHGKYSEEGINYHFLQKEPRTYAVSDKEQTINDTNQNPYDILVELNDFCNYTEKKILINELLRMKEILSPNFYELIAFINSDENFVEICNFVNDKTDLNGVFNILNNTLYIKEHEADFNSFKNFKEVINYYDAHNYEFFILVDGQILKEDNLQNVMG